MQRPMTGHAFRLGDGVLGPLPAILGPWAQVPSEMAYDAVAANAPVWSVRLPAELQAADSMLREAERELDVVHHAFPQAERRLELATEGTAHTSFAPGQPEGDLMAALAELPIQTHAPDHSFDTGRRVGDAWDRAQEAFAGFVEHLRHLVTGVSWVETAIEGSTIARTALGRLGDHATAWRHGVHPQGADLHTRAVALSLKSSAALARSLEVAFRGLSIVGMLASGPAAALLALPAVWTFVDDVVSQIRSSRVGEGRGSLLP